MLGQNNCKRKKELSLIASLGKMPVCKNNPNTSQLGLDRSIYISLSQGLFTCFVLLASTEGLCYYHLHSSLNVTSLTYLVADMAPPVPVRRPTVHMPVPSELQEPQRDVDHCSWKVHHKFCITVTCLSKVQLPDNSKVTNLSVYLL